VVGVLGYPDRAQQTGLGSIAGGHAAVDPPLREPTTHVQSPFVSSQWIGVVT
jgi:hypothetical protein